MWGISSSQIWLTVETEVGLEEGPRTSRPPWAGSDTWCPWPSTGCPAAAQRCLLPQGHFWGGTTIVLKSGSALQQSMETLREEGSPGSPIGGHSGPPEAGRHHSAQPGRGRIRGPARRLQGELLPRPLSLACAQLCSPCVLSVISWCTLVFSVISRCTLVF